MSDAFTDPRFIEPTRRRAAVVGRLGDPDDATPAPGNWAYQPMPSSPEYWHFSRQPESSTGVGLPRVRGLLVLLEFNDEPIGVATDPSAYVPLTVSTSAQIGELCHALLRRRMRA